MRYLRLLLKQSILVFRLYGPMFFLRKLYTRSPQILSDILFKRHKMAQQYRKWMKKHDVSETELMRQQNHQF